MCIRDRLSSADSASALDVLISPPGSIQNSNAKYAHLLPLPNGNIFFQSEGLYARADLTGGRYRIYNPNTCLLYTSDAADERSSVDLGGRRIIKKKKKKRYKKKQRNR